MGHHPAVLLNITQACLKAGHDLGGLDYRDGYSLTFFFLSLGTLLCNVLSLHF